MREKPLKIASIEEKLRFTIAQHLSGIETILYTSIAALLIVAAAVEVVVSAITLWRGLHFDRNASVSLLALDHMLLVLMLVEILHTVRVSIRTQHLTVVPFLVVGLIASIRRVLVITMHAATMAEQGYPPTADQALAFRYSIIELAAGAVLILVFVYSIVRLKDVSRQAIVTSTQPIASPNSGEPDCHVS